MSKWEVGDVVVFAGTPGHVGMVYTDGDAWYAHCIHATHKLGFHLGNLRMDPGDAVFRAPWDRLDETRREEKKEKLKLVADSIANTATYGMYRASRLLLGKSEFGTGARGRLQKYIGRCQDKISSSTAMGEGDKFVSTVTCAEAVILCYQITFYELRETIGVRGVFFIRKDAAHTMPKTLKKWLAVNWTEVQH